MTKHFATFFDRNYLSQGLTTISSLLAVEEDCNIFILCLDNETYHYFQTEKLKNIVPISLEEIEKWDPDLSEAKKNRNRVEYYFTLSPILALFLLETYDLAHICTMDADLYFYSTCNPIFELLKENSVILTPHKFHERLIHLRCVGDFNVSFQIFKNDSNGHAFLEEWRKLCIEWCKDELDEKNDRFADQLYLNRLFEKYRPFCYSLENEKAGIAPWNISTFELHFKENLAMLDKDICIFYHFQGFSPINKFVAKSSLKAYKCDTTNSALQKMYNHYWNQLRGQKVPFSGKNKRRKYNYKTLIQEQGLFLKLGTYGKHL